MLARPREWGAPACQGCAVTQPQTGAWPHVVLGAKVSSVQGAGPIPSSPASWAHVQDGDCAQTRSVSREPVSTATGVPDPHLPYAKPFQGAG